MYLSYVFYNEWQHVDKHPSVFIYIMFMLLKVVKIFTNSLGFMVICVLCYCWSACLGSAPGAA